MRDVADSIAAWDAAGIASAEAILVRTQHSSPRQPGARLAVNAEGEAVGAVSMGCVESDLRERLKEMLADPSVPEQLVHYGRATGGLLEVGLTCGGEIDVWLRRHDAASAAWKAVRALGSGERGALCTPLRDGERQVFAGEVEFATLGLPGGLFPGIGRNPAVTGLMAQADGPRVFVEVMEPAPRVVVVGAGPIAEALCRLAGELGWRVALADPRRQYARAERYPGAEVVHAWPEEAFAELGIGPRDAVAVLAHDEKLDIPALAAALRAGCGYVGLLGSRRMQGVRARTLAEAEGIPAEDAARIHGPIGLDIGAVEPPEIALSVMAEITLWRRGPKRG
jgi:xanthine dehydrogenase accessory factor